MFTRWCSIKKLCLAKSNYLHHDVFTMEAAFDALNKTLEPLIDVCFRFALTVNKRGNTGFELMCLALPASENHLNDDQRLSGSSVSGMVLDSTYLISPILTDEEDCSDLKQVLPCAPILFTNSALSLDDYKKIVRDTFTAIMIKFKIFQDLSYEEAVQAVQSNKVSGVVQRYKPPSSLTKNQSAPGFQGRTLSKFGASFDLKSYAPFLPTYLMCFISIHLATSTWASYRTSWTSFFDFVQHQGLKVSLPVSTQILHSYVNFLSQWKKLRVSTIKSYLSGLKKLHILNYRSTICFDDQILYGYLKGIEHFEACQNEAFLQRNVITFPVLKIWGHSIFTSDLSLFDQHVLWTGFYFNTLIFNFFYYR